MIIGGLVFGTGMAILGYCPGTLAISLGEGSLDAFTGILGGIAGGLVFTFLWPSIQVVLGPDLGSISLTRYYGFYPDGRFIKGFVYKKEIDSGS